MVEKYFSKTIPQFFLDDLSEEQKQNAIFVTEIANKVSQSFDEFKIADALHEIWKIIAFADKHIAEQKPWEIAKHNDEKNIAHLANVIATVVASLRAVGYLAYPFFPEKMKELLTSIGEEINNQTEFYSRIQNYFKIHSGFKLNEIPKLYSRIDINAEFAKMSEEKQTATAPVVQNIQPTISIDDFAKVEMRVGTVTSAELVEGSDKLLKLTVSLGELGSKQIFAGIRQWVKPEDIANRKVIIVANLAPRKMKFGTSEGMMLATDTCDGKVSPIYLPEELKEGGKLS